MAEGSGYTLSETPLLLWVLATIAALATPILGYFSPFGRTRRGIVKELRVEIEELQDDVAKLKQELKDAEDKLRDSLREQGATERERNRLLRENFDLYRELADLKRRNSHSPPPHS